MSKYVSVWRQLNPVPLDRIWKGLGEPKKARSVKPPLHSLRVPVSRATLFPANLPRPWEHPCFVCGIAFRCRHREPELADLWKPK
jgi:hypothetical protein